ncbi:peptidase S9 prolyl oligopeptidase active site-containing protein [Coniochaeta ligniaria NRRL 30616]|uniref:Peptidase S9 prolyl oligopeptidase active site-containing protein n=1 Tax=Coniochaeta ligniaria NRRL 30616 TaxID=1408157 RepID=A0A1J7I4M0_9PEZI|nr:peptidase S9 prolyl oligopeptidase active site-containing protein [Coniochaeta ligniaria NRRL 30616]
MAVKTVAPYGKWTSPLTAEAVTAGSRSLSSPRADPVSARGFFLESRANGTQGIVEVLPSGGTRHVLPESSSASTIVYEYGGLPYAVVPAGKKDQALRIIFSDARDKSVNLLDVDSGRVTSLLRSTTLRYADFDVHPRVSDGTETAWVLAVEEDHEKPKPADVRNYVVAINIETAEVKRLASTADFYSYPRFSPDGKKVVWKQWDHPQMPFTETRLHWADWKESGAVDNVEFVAGGDGECVTEPRWSPDGTLFFCGEKSNFRQLFRRKLDESEATLVELDGLEEYEFGDSSFMLGCQGYVFLTETSLIAAPVKFGSYDIFHIDLTTSTWTKLDTPLKDMRFDNLARLSSTSFLAVGAGYTAPEAVYSITVTSTGAEVKLVCSCTDTDYPPSLFSTPVPINFPSRKGNPPRNVHGFFWPPHNPSFSAPEGTLPPLLITTHGGPTAHSRPGLKMMDQYFLTRGYAVFAINYTGSSGHGRDYREALYGRWGIADTDDAGDAAEFLARTGRVDGRRVGIVGGSAGGYNVLQSLVHYSDAFAGGVCYCGVSDVRALDVETHKMESRYMDMLMGFDDETPQDVRQAVLKERSPLFRAEEIRASLLLIHGDADTIVPIQQSWDVKERIDKRGGDVQMIVLEGEGHMFKRAESWQTIVEQGEKWWQKTLLRKLD